MTRGIDEVNTRTASNNTVPFSTDLASELRFVNDAGFLGDGEHGYYVVHSTVDGTRDVHHLFMFPLSGGGAHRRLGGEFDDIGAVAASVRGEHIAVVVECDGKDQIVLLSPDDDSSRLTLTDMAQGVSGGPVWSPDGNAIAFTAGPAVKRDPDLPYRVDRITYRFDSVGYLDDAVTNLYLLDIESGAVRQLTDDRSMNNSPRFSPDGSLIAYLVSFPPDRGWQGAPELHVLDVASGRSRLVLDDTWGGVSAAEWCPDGRHIAFVGWKEDPKQCFTSRKTDLFTIDLDGGEPECRTASLLTGVGSVAVQTDLPVWRVLTEDRVRVAGDDAYTSAQVGGDVVVSRVSLFGQESTERVCQREGASVYFVDFEPQSGVLAYETTFLDPPDLVLGSKRITSFNDAVLQTSTRPAVNRFEVSAPDGFQSEAWAFTPPGEAGPFPTVLYIHGGPSGAFGSTFVIDFHLLVGAGYAVIAHNFRGSVGYGNDSSLAIWEDWGRLGSIDHHAALDEAIRLGIVDPDRLGVCGLSHGGFATCWLVGTSDRFKAGVAENPVTSWASFYGVTDASDFPWMAQLLSGPPHDKPARYRDLSPLTHAPSCRTPVLFVIGEEDWRCHAVESEQYYRVLKANGVPSEMVRLPKSSHAASAYGPVPSRIAQNEALLDWFGRFLK